jgi:hypothetical protein
MDPKSLEYAALHADKTLPLPWQEMDPREAAIRGEELAEQEMHEGYLRACRSPSIDPQSQIIEVENSSYGGANEFSNFAEMQELFLCYVFADSNPAEWQNAAVRAHALLATLWPGIIAGRSRHTLAAIVGQARQVTGFPLSDVTRRFSEECVRAFAPVMEYYFPDIRNWLITGTQNLYLIARLYQPGLVTRWQKDITYEQLAQIFGELPLVRGRLGTDTPPEDTPAEAWRKACGAARARWSARAQSLIARKIVSAGGRRPGMYGKGGEVAEKYRAAAMGNQNRRKS